MSTRGIRGAIMSTRGPFQHTRGPFKHIVLCTRGPFLPRPMTVTDGTTGFVERGSKLLLRTPAQTVPPLPAA